mmetsp:Transcript_28166/g.54904  ORF Transcript_28166/g.54904 Transcript_28166/m.54904 type:complete len:88 (+) Transcript_28166:2-265(+)
MGRDRRHVTFGSGRHSSMLFVLLLSLQPMLVMADSGDVLAMFFGVTLSVLGTCALIGYWSRLHYNISAGSGDPVEDASSTEENLVFL